MQAENYTGILTSDASASNARSATNLAMGTVRLVKRGIGSEDQMTLGWQQPKEQ
jgi:hypothetical protein